MLFNGIEHGWLTFRVGATFPLANAADAHQALVGRETTGKVLLTVRLRQQPPNNSAGVLTIKKGDARCESRRLSHTNSRQLPSRLSL